MVSGTPRWHSGRLRDADPLFFKQVFALARQQDSWKSWKQVEDLTPGELHDWGAASKRPNSSQWNGEGIG